MDSFWYYAAVPILLCVSGFLSGSETAIFSIRHEDISILKKSNRRLAKQLTNLIESSQKTLFLILFLNIFVNITIVGLITGITSGIFSSNTSIISFVASTVLLLVFGETIPKNIAINTNIRFASVSAPVLFFLKGVFNPLLQFLKSLNSLLLDFFRLHLWKPDPYLTFDEFKNDIIEKKLNNEVSSEEAEIILNITESGSIPVKKISTPISEIPFIPVDETAGRAVEIMKHNNSLVCCISSDLTKSGKSIHGLLHIAAAMSAPPKKKAADLISVPLWIPEHTPLAEAAQKMLHKNKEIVCLINEFGEFSGFAYLRNCLSSTLHTKDIAKEQSGKAFKKISGSEKPESVIDWLPASLKRDIGKYTTINGLLSNFLGKIPKNGEVLAIDDIIFYINYAEPNRIRNMTIKKRRRKSDN